MCPAIANCRAVAIFPQQFEFKFRVIEVLRIGFPKFLGRSRSSQKGQIRPHERIGVCQALKAIDATNGERGSQAVHIWALGSHREGGG